MMVVSEFCDESMVGDDSVFRPINYRPPEFIDAPEALKMVGIDQIGAGIIAVLGKVAPERRSRLL